MIRKKITRKRISLAYLTRILKEKEDILPSQIVSSIQYVKKGKNLIITCIEDLEIPEPNTSLLSDPKKIREVMLKPISELDIPLRVLKILKSRELETIGQVKSIGEKSLRKSRGFGDGSALDVRLALNALGLNFDEPED